MQFLQSNPLLLSDSEVSELDQLNMAVQFKGLQSKYDTNYNYDSSYGAIPQNKPKLSTLSIGIRTAFYSMYK